jgi:hypothetical protein
MKDQLGVAEIEFGLACQDCGCHAVFMASTAIGKRSKSPYPRCCQCGRERRDLSNAVLSIHGNRLSHLATAGQVGREMARQIIPIVPLLFTDVGIELKKLPEDGASTALNGSGSRFTGLTPPVSGDPGSTR